MYTKLPFAGFYEYFKSFFLNTFLEAAYKLSLLGQMH